MPRRMAHPDAVVSEAQRRIALVEEIHRRLWFGLEAEHQALLNDAVVEKQILAMETNRRFGERLFGAPHAGDVVEMGVRQQNVFDVETMLANGLNQQLDVVARVDDDAFTSPFTTNDKAVFHERPSGPGLENHGRSEPSSFRTMMAE